MKTRRRKIFIALTLGVLLAGVLVAYSRFAPRANYGAGYVAKEVCSCVFIAGRDMSACRLDLGPSIDPVRSVRVPAGIRAWVPLFASRTARFREGTGCTLE